MPPKATTQTPSSKRSAQSSSNQGSSNQGSSAQGSTDATKDTQPGGKAVTVSNQQTPQRSSTKVTPSDGSQVVNPEVPKRKPKVAQETTVPGSSLVNTQSRSNSPAATNRSRTGSIVGANPALKFAKTLESKRAEPAKPKDSIVTSGLHTSQLSANQKQNIQADLKNVYLDNLDIIRKDNQGKSIMKEGTNTLPTVKKLSDNERGVRVARPEHRLDYYELSAEERLSKYKRYWDIAQGLIEDPAPDDEPLPPPKLQHQESGPDIAMAYARYRAAKVMAEVAGDLANDYLAKAQEAEEALNKAQDKGKTEEIVQALEKADNATKKWAEANNAASRARLETESSATHARALELAKARADKAPAQASDPPTQPPPKPPAVRRGTGKSKDRSFGYQV